MINVSEALDSDNSKILIVDRYDKTLVNGLAVKTKVISFKVLASAQQPTSKQVAMLPEGLRGSSARVFICNKEIRSDNNKDGVTGDVITYNKKRYRFVKDNDWSDYGYTVGIAVRDDST